MSEVVTDSDGREYVPLDMPQHADRSNQFKCPHCDTQLQFRLSLTVRGVREVLEDGSFVEPSRQSQPASMKDTRLMDYYRTTGILQAFETTVREVKATHLPHDISGFLLTWLKSAAPIMVPQLTMRRLFSEFGGTIEVYQSQEIAAVLSNGVLRSFVSVHLLRGELVRAGKGSSIRVKTQANDVQLDNWIRTKHGYVVGTGTLFSEMQGKSKGAFDTSRL